MPPSPSSRLASALVATGILLSRVIGLVRERVVATYFGTGLHADVFGAGLRMPNVLQNLLGEGTLSASFIPAYSELLGQGRTQDAGRLAGAIFALLLAIAGAIALVGIVLAPVLVSVFTPGFDGARRELMIAVVRIIFPMAGVLVLSAWALGILNSHRKFFVPYFAPVLWNVAIIAALVGFANGADLDQLLMAAAWGALAGGVLQFGIQLPWVFRLNKEIRIAGFREPSYKEVVRNAGPAILGRGVVQLSTYVDMVLASLLAIGAVARLRYAQTLYVLPISLFGMSIAAAELPELARDRTAGIEALRERTVAALRRVAFYVVPSLVAFVMLGHVFVAGIYLAGEFGAQDVTIVWLILAAYSLGLLASTSSRIFQSAFFALRDTKTPARVAALRVLTSAVVGAALMLQLEPIAFAGVNIGGGWFGDLRIGTAPLGPIGLALGAAVGGWFEWFLLRRNLSRALGNVAIGAGELTRLFGSALGGAAVGHGLYRLLPGVQPLLAAALVAGVFGATYIAMTWAAGITETRVLVGAMHRRMRGRQARIRGQGTGDGGQ